MKNEFEPAKPLRKSATIIILLICLPTVFLSCEKKLKEPGESSGNGFIILKKDEPLIKKKEPVYSYPPNVKAADQNKYEEEEIEKMAQELGMKGFHEGNKRYYKNSKHMIFLPEQIPTIYDHKEEYFQELDELW